MIVVILIKKNHNRVHVQFEIQNTVYIYEHQLIASIQ
jgi:hypothetical protein